MGGVHPRHKDGGVRRRAAAVRPVRRDRDGDRPPFNFPGAWLYSAGHPVLHINDISGTDKEQRPDSGVIDHVAFGSRGFDAIKQHLARKGVAFRVNEVPNSSRRQIFVTDPNNVLIELNFDVAKETPAR